MQGKSAVYPYSVMAIYRGVGVDRDSLQELDGLCCHLLGHKSRGGRRGFTREESAGFLQEAHRYVFVPREHGRCHRDGDRSSEFRIGGH